MEPLEYLTILRRRWRVVVAFLGLGVVLALVAPAPDPTATATVWQADAVLAPVTAGESAAPLGDVGLLADSDGVLDGVVVDVEAMDDPRAVATLTEATSTEGGLVAVSAIGGAKDEAEELANSFAARLAEQAGTQLDELRAQQIRLLESTLAALPAEPPAAAEGVEGAAQARTQLLAEISRLQASQGISPLAVLQRAVATPQASSSVLAPPSDPLVRILLFGAMGLFAGVAVALIVERVDPRLLTPSELGRAHRMRVLATTPSMPEPQAGVPFTVMNPDTSAADAFRSLRMSLLLASPNVPGTERAAGSGRHAATDSPAPRRPSALDTSRVVLFTAGRAGVGVTTTVTNLAVAFAASGMSVLLVDADQRTHRLSDEFGLHGKRGVSDLLSRAAITADDVREVISNPPMLPELHVLTAGSTQAFHGADPARTEQLLFAAREIAQIVLIDAAALLESVEALELAPFVDGVVVVARPGGTTREGATQVSGALAQLGIPAFGLVAARERGGERVRRTATAALGWRGPSPDRHDSQPSSDVEAAEPPSARRRRSKEPAGHPQ